MFEKIIGDSSKIKVLAVDSNLEVSEVSDECSITNGNTYFIRLEIEGVENYHKIPMAIIRFANNGGVEGKELEIFRCNSVDFDNFASLTGTELMNSIVSDDSQVLKVKFDTPKVEVLEDVKQKQEVGKIEDAKHLVAVGRGCGNDESLENAKVLADLLGGSVATARSLVDEGKLPQDKQVGQTGKTVRPDLYLAFGISGAVQHLAGMEDSDYIIAINKDKGASIFNVADLGIVGDGNAILPLVIEEIKNL